MTLLRSSSAYLHAMQNAYGYTPYHVFPLRNVGRKTSPTVREPRTVDHPMLTCIYGPLIAFK